MLAAAVLRRRIKDEHRLSGRRQTSLVIRFRLDKKCKFYSLQLRDCSIAIQDGFSTGTTPGNGLVAAKRRSGAFNIYSTIGSGTVIMCRVNSIKKGAASENPEDVDGFQVGAINNLFRGEFISGVHETNSGFTVTIVDGLGHGPLANQAAIKELHVFAEKYQAPVTEVQQKIHTDLRASRGAVVFLLATNGNLISYTGVGNIFASLQTSAKTKALSSQNSTADLSIGTLQLFEEKWDVNDYFIFYSDGLSNRWDLDQYLGIKQKHPAILAALRFKDFDRGTDNSTVVVVQRLK